MTNQNHSLEAIVALICAVAATGIVPDSLFFQSKSPSITKRSIGNANAAQDLYGVGIRVGFYLQALAGAIAVIRPLRSPGGGTPIIFSSAVFIAILAAWTKMAVNRDISPAETIVVINMLGSNSNAIINAIYNTGIRGSAIGLLICILMHIWEVCIMVWFWPVGQHKLPALRTGGYTWFFVKVDIDGWYKWMMTAFSAIGVILLILLIGGLGLHFLNAVHWWWKSSSDEARWTIKNYPDLPRKKQDYDNVKLALRSNGAYSLFIFPFFVATAEMTIVYNKLEPYGDISTPGQLIPFVAGLTSLVDVVSFVFRPEKVPTDLEEEFVL